jgi:hypothetical protein
LSTPRYSHDPFPDHGTSGSSGFFVVGATQNSQGPLIGRTSSTTVCLLIRSKGTEQPQRRSKPPEPRRTGLRPVVAITKWRTAPRSSTRVDKSAMELCTSLSAGSHRVTIQVLRPDRIGAGRCLDQHWYPARDPGKYDDLPPGCSDPRPGERAPRLPRKRSTTPRDRCLGIQPNLGKFDIAGDVELPKIAICTHHARRSG